MRYSTFKAFSLVKAAVFLVGLVCLQSVWAVAGPPLYCDAQFYQIRGDTSGGPNNNTGYLVRYNLLTSLPDNPYGGATSFSPPMNSLGYNPKDNYLYAVANDAAPNSNLYRLGQSGVELVGAIAGLTGYSAATAGTFDAAGRYYLAGQNNGLIGPSTIFRIDNIPSAGTSAALTVARSYALNASVTNIGDFAFATANNGPNGTLYGASVQGGANLLARIVLNDAAGTAAVTTLTWATPVIGGIGSAFFDTPTGKFYVYNNGAADFYEITNVAAGAPGSILVAALPPGFVPATFVNSSTDGTSCRYANAQVADLSVSKSVSPLTTLTSGQTATFTLVLGNLGTSPAQTVTLSDVLPAGLTYVSNVASAGTYTPGSGAWVVPSLPVGVTQTLTLVTTVSASGTASGSFLNRVGILSANQTGTTTVIALTDPVTANNTATAAPVVGLSVNLAITKTNSVGTVAAGSTTAYSITVSNASGFNAANSVLRDLPAVGLSCTTQPTCVVLTGTATCPAPGAGPGQLSIANLQDASVAGGVAIPLLAVGSSVRFTVICGVTATGL